VGGNEFGEDGSSLRRGHALAFAPEVLMWARTDLLELLRIGAELDPDASGRQL
jgi:hypothetical protein